MRLSLIVIGFLFSSFISFASGSTPADTTANLADRAAALFLIDKGKTLFLEGKVRDALQEFRAAAIKDPNSSKAPFWVAQCHYVQNNYGYALKYANEAVKLSSDDVDKEAYELLARAQHRLGILDSAIINYENALASMSKARAKELGVELRIKQAKFAQSELSSGKSPKRIRMSDNINSGYDDYLPVLTNNGTEIYFASRRSDTKGGNMNPEDQVFFEDVYHAVWNSETKDWDSVSNDLGRINSEGFDALTYISPNGMNALMTINTEALDKKKTTKGSDIFELEKSSKGLWSTPKKINNKTINTSFFEGSATMTDDGNTMYFASDRNGKKSSVDIFMVERVGKKWGEAKALPMGVNTTGYETTPFITGDGRYLFYSSEGLEGMGGLDIYVVENLGGGQWGEPVNLGVMVNSVNNDTHFQYYPKMNKAVMASFEISGQKASMDLYEVDMTGYSIPTEPKK
jgi:tetratricopeptide (TPR) repeat protein